MATVSILAGAGYAGGVLIDELARHPRLSLGAIHSRSHAGQRVSVAHPWLRGSSSHVFTGSIDDAVENADAVFVAAGHGDGMKLVDQLLSGDFDGPIVDLSADFRIKDETLFLEWYGREHVRPDLLERSWYGIPEITGPPVAGSVLVANPGCFATAISMALYPVSRHSSGAPAAVTALTGASGSGTLPIPETHFPNRDGNIRAYDVLQHRHQVEIQTVLGPDFDFSFVPVSGPWTRGIWGSATLALPAGTEDDEVAGWFDTAYSDCKLVRLSAGSLPEMGHVVGTPFCDLGWVTRNNVLVVGFALDNLMKGAASQAIQNMNLLFGWEDYVGLIPAPPLELTA